MKQLIGLFIIAVGLALGLYVGVWIMFVGGIVGLIEAIRAPELLTNVVAINIAKIVLCSLGGWSCAMPFYLVGAVLIKD